MNYAQEIKKLEETRAAVVGFIADLNAKLERNEVNGIEYHLILSEKLCGRTKDELFKMLDDKIKELHEKEDEEKNSNKRKTIITVSATAIILIIAIIATIIYTNPGSLTGYVIVNNHPIDESYTAYTEKALNFTNITSLKISGTLEGSSARIILRTESQDYLIANLVNSNEKNITKTYSLRTDKSTYAIGENVSIILEPQTENTSLYIIYGSENHLLENTTYMPEQAGEYTVRALIVTASDILRLEAGFNVTNETTNETEQQDNTVSQTITESVIGETTNLTFENLCSETCTLPNIINATLIIEPSENSKLTITNITTEESAQNTAPMQILTIPDITITTNENRIIDLNQYFTDLDKNTLNYDISVPPELSAKIEQNLLTLSSPNAGSYTAYVYATDGVQLITSNTFIITVTENNLPLQNESNSTNETNTINPTNENDTINSTTEMPIINETSNVSQIISGIDCSNPDPNKRPLECIEGYNSSYFKPEDLFIENKNAMAVGKITPIGNLMIRGRVIQNSAGTAGANDYQLGFVNENGDYVPTVWIDSESGDLHLRGTLTETNGNIPMSEGYSAIANKRNIVLVLVNRQTGDVIVRGNVIPYREQLK